ncbi:MAG: peptide deformylase [Candidatus Dadabacteria bacterium]|nr:peptide deformylase [Candidatus Dadabacteria bacterium]
MAILPVLRYPHPALRAKCKAVEDTNDEIRTLFEDMTETMCAYPGCVGLAAPQVGVVKRLFVIDVSRKIGPKKNHGLLKLLNPVITYSEGEKISREGCLSIPEFLGDVKRARRVILRALDESGEEIEVPAKGLEAIAIQHELDHLDGILFIDKVSSLGRNLIRRED